MSKPQVAIVTDSTTYFPTAIRERYSIAIAPQVLILEDKEFRDEIDITASEFYTRLKTEKLVAKTSQASVKDFADIYRRLHEEGYSSIIAVVISQELSGTFNSATQAQSLVPEANVTVVDSRSASMGLGMMVWAAARAAVAGKSREEVLQVIDTVRPNTGIMFTVDTLDYLQRGGRIGGAQALLGNALNLKPVLEADLNSGRVESLQRIRTKKKAIAFIADEVVRRVGTQGDVYLTAIHALAEDEATELVNEVKRRLGDRVKEAYVSEASPIICAHTGPGTVGLAYGVGL